MKKILGMTLVLALSAVLFGNEFRENINGRNIRFVEVENSDYSGALQKLSISKSDADRVGRSLIQEENCISDAPDWIIDNKQITRKIGVDDTYLFIMPADEYSTTLKVHVVKRIDGYLSYMSAKAQGSSFSKFVNDGLDTLNYLFNKGADWAGNAIRNGKEKADERARRKEEYEKLDLY